MAQPIHFDTQIFPRSDAVSSESSPLSYALGEHTVMLYGDGSVELANSQIAMQLTADEAYKLLVCLQSLFS